MRKLIKLDKRGVSLLKTILKEIIEDGKTTICPNWEFHSLDKADMLKKGRIAVRSSCMICSELFPKVDFMYCPCQKYKPSYLVKRLREIIRYNRKGKK